MIEPIPGDTPLSALAEHAASNVEWWKEDAPKHNELQLPTRVILALGHAGIHTLDQLRAAGPHKLRELDGVGKLGFNQIVALLRALDRQNGP